MKPIDSDHHWPQTGPLAFSEIFNNFKQSQSLSIKPRTHVHTHTHKRIS